MMIAEKKETYMYYSFFLVLYACSATMVAIKLKKPTVMAFLVPNVFAWTF